MTVILEFDLDMIKMYHHINALKDIALTDRQTNYENIAYPYLREAKVSQCVEKIITDTAIILTKNSFPSKWCSHHP